MTMADSVKTVEQLCAENGIDARQLAERSGLDEQRVVAIVLGRWTPSPQERDGIAARLRAGTRPDCLGPQDPRPAPLWTGPGLSGRQTRDSNQERLAG